MTAQAWIAGMVGVAAVIDDLTRRRISNWIPCSAFAGGVVLQSIQGGWRGAGSALLGTVVGASVFLIFYLLGGMGGGDIKLMAGFGAILGVARLLEASLWVAGCGGLIAVLVIVGNSLRQMWRAKFLARGQVENSTNHGRVQYIPYAPAIAAGVWLSLVPRT